MIKKGLVILGVFLGLASLVNIIQVNRQNTKIVVENYNKNEWVIFDDQTEIKVTDFQLLSQEALKDLITANDGDYKNYEIEDTEMRAVLLTIQKKSNGQSKNNIAQSVLVSGGFSNGINLQATSLINEEEDSDTQKFLYTITDNLVTKKHWDEMDKMKFYLAVNYTPVEKRIILN